MGQMKIIKRAYELRTATPYLAKTPTAGVAA
jgi:hypothetical protein